MEPRCYGSDKSAFGDFEQEGTSAYMLFYERVQKKDIRIVVKDKQKFAEFKQQAEVRVK